MVVGWMRNRWAWGIPYAGSWTPAGDRDGSIGADGHLDAHPFADGDVLAYADPDSDRDTDAAPQSRAL